MAEQLDGEVSSGSLSCHSQSATPFCQIEGREKGGRAGRKKDRRGRVDAEGPTIPQSCLPSVLPFRDPPARQEPQISSFSSSCAQPTLDLIACPVLFLVPDSPLHLFSSVFLSTLYLLSSFFRAPLRPPVFLASRSQPGEPRIDLMRIIPALIAEAHGMIQAVLVRLAVRPAGWSTR